MTGIQLHMLDLIGMMDQAATARARHAAAASAPCNIRETSLIICVMNKPTGASKCPPGKEDIQGPL